MKALAFNFENHQVRSIILKNEPWFVATDVCKSLNIKNVTQAIERLDNDERSMFNIGRQGEVNIINESGLFTLILRCRDAVNKGTVPYRFRKWVTSEVLPSIRKTGSYSSNKNLYEVLRFSRFLISFDEDLQLKIMPVSMNSCVIDTDSKSEMSTIMREFVPTELIPDLMEIGLKRIARSIK